MIRKVLSSIFILFFLPGCVSTDTTTTTRTATNGVTAEQVLESGKTVQVVKTLRCPTPVAKLSISPMKCQAARCSKTPKASGNLAVILKLSDNGIKDFSTLGDSMTTMLSTAIASTNCFTLLDRQAMATLKQEMELAGREFKPQTSDFVISGAITSFEYAEKKSGLGGGALTLGGLFSNKETTAKMGLDLMLINTNSSAIEYSRTYQSDAKNDEYKVGLFGFGSGSGALGGAAFGGSVEVEEAVRTVINKSVYDLIQHTAAGQYTETVTQTGDE